MKSRMRRPKMISAGLTFDTGSGVFLYANMARWNLSVLRVPPGPVLPVSSRLTVFTPSSALQLLWGLATLLTRCNTPRLRRKVSVVPALNSGPSSEESSSAMPKVTNTLRSAAMRPFEPSAFSSTMGQLE